jgi:hypothetical protein
MLSAFFAGAIFEELNHYLMFGSIFKDLLCCMAPPDVVVPCAFSIKAALNGRTSYFCGEHQKVRRAAVRVWGLIGLRESR